MKCSDCHPYFMMHKNTMVIYCVSREKSELASEQWAKIAVSHYPNLSCRQKYRMIHYTESVVHTSKRPFAHPKLRFDQSG